MWSHLRIFNLNLVLRKISKFRKDKLQSNSNPDEWPFINCVQKRFQRCGVNGLEGLGSLFIRNGSFNMSCVTIWIIKHLYIYHIFKNLERSVGLRAGTVNRKASKPLPTSFEQLLSLTITPHGYMEFPNIFKQPQTSLIYVKSIWPKNPGFMNYKKNPHQKTLDSDIQGRTIEITVKVLSTGFWGGFPSKEQIL